MFENANGVLSHTVYGTKNRGKELVENLKLHAHIMALRYSVRMIDVTLRKVEVRGNEMDCPLMQTDGSHLKNPLCSLLVFSESCIE